MVCSSFLSQAEKCKKQWLTAAERLGGAVTVEKEVQQQEEAVIGRRTKVRFEGHIWTEKGVKLNIAGRGKQQNRRRKDKRNDGDNSMERRPIILAKPDRNSEFPTLQQAQQQAGPTAKDGKEGGAAVGAVTEGVAAMGIREAVMTSLKPTTRAESPAEPQPPPTNTTPKPALARKAPVSEFSLFDPPSGSTFNANPERNCKFVDDLHQMQDSLLHFLTDNEDFLVVGVLGPQSSGKSTVINAMHAREENEAKIFREQNFERQVAGEHCTVGISAWISPQRVVYLDCQPINSISVLERYMQAEKRYTV